MHTDKAVKLGVKNDLCQQGLIICGFKFFFLYLRAGFNYTGRIHLYYI